MSIRDIVFNLSKIQLQPEKEFEQLSEVTDKLSQIARTISHHREELDADCKEKLKVFRDKISHVPENEETTFIKELASRLFSAIFQLSVRYNDPLPRGLDQLAGSYLADVHLIPLRPSKANFVNHSEMDRWVQAHPQKEAQLAARAAAEAVEHISQEEFENEFKAPVRWFNQELSSMPGGGQNYWALSWTQKSNQWMLELALSQLEALPKEVLEIDDLMNCFPTALTKHENKLPQAIVIFDDGIYSGNQLCEVINDLKDQFANAKVPLPQIFIVCPFSLIEGSERVRSIPNAKIKICPNREIPSLKSKILSKPGGRGLWETLLKMGLNNHPSPDRIGSLFYDHKVPDAISFPFFITEGIVYDLKGDVVCFEQKFALISPTIPPYKG
jgi:hypothetical protein